MLMNVLLSLKTRGDRLYRWIPGWETVEKYISGKQESNSYSVSPRGLFRAITPTGTARDFSSTRRIEAASI
jgi:hypothetical protein